MTAATTQRTAEEREGELRTFGLLLQGLEDGQALVDLNDKLRELVGKIVRVAEAARRKES